MTYEIRTLSAMDRDFQFLLNSDIDYIQGEIRAGHFYELEELKLIANYSPNPKYILDVGANIGNHSVYFAHKFDPIRTIPIEPNPLVLPLLRANIGLNWHRSFDLSLIGYGFSDRTATAIPFTATERNLGATKLQVDKCGNIPLVPADKVLPDAAFDLIKIDVEGMETEVVSGMSGILSRSRATIFIEVLLCNIDAIMMKLSSLGYQYRTSYQRYESCINLLFSKSSHNSLVSDPREIKQTLS